MEPVSAHTYTQHTHSHSHSHTPPHTHTHSHTHTHTHTVPIIEVNITSLEANNSTSLTVWWTEPDCREVHAPFDEVEYYIRYSKEPGLSEGDYNVSVTREEVGGGMEGECRHVRNPETFVSSVSVLCQ